MIKLTDNNLIVRSPQARDEKGLVEFSRRNREFLYPTGLVVLPDDLTEERWVAYIKKSADDLKNDKAVRLLIFEKNNPDIPIGKINFTEIVRGHFQACYLGYGLDQSMCSKGYMTSALKLAIEYMLTEKNMHRIMANYLPDNFASARVLEKLGFIIEGTAKNYLMINGVWRDHVLTSLTNDNWRLSK